MTASNRPDWHVVEVLYQRGGLSPYTDIYGPFPDLETAVEFKIELKLKQETNHFASALVAVRRVSEPSISRLRRSVQDFLSVNERR